MDSVSLSSLLVSPKSTTNLKNKISVELSWKELIYQKSTSIRLSSHNVINDNENKCIFMFGGRSKPGASNHLYILKEIDKGWELLKTKGTIPTPRKSSAMTYMNGHLYLFGGNYNNELCNDFYSFNIQEKTWHLIKSNGNCPCARDRHSLLSINNKLYLFGGHSDKDEFLNDLYVYDIKMNTWNIVTTNEPPIARYEHVAASIDNLLIISGGRSPKGGLSDYWILDVTSEKPSWTIPTIANDIKKDPRWGQTCIVFDKKLIFFGGWNGTFCFNDVYIIDCSQNNWKYLQVNITGQKPPIRTFHGSAILGTKMIIVAGRNMTNRFNDTYALELQDLTLNGLKSRKSLIETTHLLDNLPIDKKMSQLQKDFEVKKKKISLESFNLQATLGTGSFGRVRLVQYKLSQEYFAMKILQKKHVIEMKQECHIKWEKKILSSIRHPFIVNLEASFQDKYCLYLILEFVGGGEFFSLLRRTGTLQSPHVAFYASQIILVFQFLHKNKIVYRDLKPENLLISTDGYLRLTDFGFAKKLEQPYRTWTLCGTPEYIAPEILLNRGHAFSVDWWALGILLYEMFTSGPPFVDDNPMKIYQKILDGRIRYPNTLPTRAKDLISKLLTKNLTQRLGNSEYGAIDVMKHPFFEGLNWKHILEKKTQAPYYPRIDSQYDTKYFDNYNDTSDNENQEITDDPFLNDF